VQNNKQAQYRQMLQKVSRITDNLGMHIDEKIKLLVVALNLMGFNTRQSCEGHTDHSMGSPWVDIAPPNQPDERFVREKHILNQVAKKLGFKETLEEIRKTNIDAFCTIYDIAKEKYQLNPETKKYKVWHAKLEPLKSQLNALLKEFYKNRHCITRKSRLRIWTFCEDFRLFNGGTGWMQGDFKLTYMFSNKEKTGHASRLKLYQEEMNEFAKFLINKYFNSNQF
jgi:hypothetical protein